MNVNLGATFDQFVAGLLKTALYQSQSEILREDRQELKRNRLAELRKEIDAGSEQADRGHFVDGTDAFAKIRQRSAQRKQVKK